MLDEQRVKDIVMIEVAKQIKPIADEVRAAREWQLSFWSNGSGRPPGYFQTRVKEDDARYTALATETAKQSDLLENRYEQLATETVNQSKMLDQLQTETAKQSVALATVSDFVKTANIRQLESEFRKKASEKRWRSWKPILVWAGSILGPALLGFIIWLGHIMVPIVHVLIDDYLRTHPLVMERLKNTSSGPSVATDSSMAVDQSVVK